MTLASDDVTLQISFLGVGSTGSATNGNVFDDADSRNEPGRLGSRDRYRLAAVHRSSTDRGYLFKGIGVGAGRNRDGLDVCVGDRLGEIQSDRIAGRILAERQVFSRDGRHSANAHGEEKLRVRYDLRCNRIRGVGVPQKRNPASAGEVIIVDGSVRNDRTRLG